MFHVNQANHSFLEEKKIDKFEPKNDASECMNSMNENSISVIFEKRLTDGPMDGRTKPLIEMRGRI